MALNRLVDQGFLGRFQVGQKLPLFVRTVDVNGIPREPDEAPRVRIFDSSGSLVAIADLPMRDRFGATGVFSGEGQIGAAFSVGRYEVFYTFTASGYSGFSRGCFEVVAGGDPSGSLISLFSVANPEASYILAQDQAGHLLRGRGPRIE